jgi:arylsulfatase
LIGRFQCVVLVVFLCAGLACGTHEDAAPSDGPPLPNVLLVSIDTLRADRLGVYGYPRGTTPHLDAFAEQAIRYAQAWAPSPWTLPSHVALLTGRHPSEIGIRHMKSRIPESVPTLAECFAEAGYQTAAFVDSTQGGFVGGRRGFARGFQTYEHAPFRPDTGRRYDVANTVTRGLEWLDGRDRDRPFFLFLHTKSVHSLRADESAALDDAPPYHAPEPFHSRFAGEDSGEHRWIDAEGNAGSSYLRGLNEKLARGALSAETIAPEARAALSRLYDGGVAYVDDQIGRLLEELRRRDLLDGSLVAITSDHGEAFLEHRLFLHLELHREVLHVPLLVKPPRGPEEVPQHATEERAAPRRGVVEAPVALQDLAPTLLTRAGLKPPPGMDAPVLPGPADREDSTPRDLFSYAQFKDDHYYGGFAIRRGRLALIEDRLAGQEHYHLRFYDMEADPGERHPLEDGEGAALLELLQAWPGRQPIDGEGEIELDPETLENLRSLGYLE